MILRRGVAQVLRLAVAALPLALLATLPISSQVSADIPPPCSRSALDSTNCNSANCTTFGGQWIPPDRWDKTTPGTCLPDPQACNYQYLSNCKDPKQCTDSGGVIFEKSGNCVAKLSDSTITPGGGSQGGSGTPPSVTPKADKCQVGTGNFFGLVPWWHYLPDSDFGAGAGLECSLNQGFNPLSTSAFPLILLAVIDDLLRIAGVLAVGFMLYGAVQYITSQGNPEDTSKALKTIINALVGLAITIFAVAFISFIGSSLGK